MLVGRADNRAKSAARSTCSVDGQLVLHGATRARAARHGTRKDGCDGTKPHPPTWCGVG